LKFEYQDRYPTLFQPGKNCVITSIDSSVKHERIHDGFT
jgi:hypothetical protein